MGTPAYMAPEQAAGAKDVGTAADVYALGGILYRLLSGRPPFTGPTTLDVLICVMEDEPVPLRKTNPKVPRDLETIAHKCLQKQRDKRYATAADLADDLERFREGEPIRARRVPLLERAWRWSWKYPALAGLRGFLGLGVSVVLSLALLGILSSPERNYFAVAGLLLGVALFFGFTRARPKPIAWGVVAGAVCGGVLLVLVLRFGVGLHDAAKLPNHPPAQRGDLVAFGCLLPLFLGTLVGVACRERWYLSVAGGAALLALLIFVPAGFGSVLFSCHVTFVVVGVARLIRRYRGGTLLDVIAGMNGGFALFGFVGAVLGSCLLGPLWMYFRAPGDEASMIWFLVAVYGIGLLVGLAGAILVGCLAAKWSNKAHRGTSPLPPATNA
jgi:hypothetical protein